MTASIKQKILGACIMLLRIAIFFIVACLLLRVTIAMTQDPREEQYYDYGAFNDTLIESSGTIYNCGAIMVQLDWFCDIIGAEMTQNKRTVTINWQDKELIIKLYSRKATLNGEVFYQDNAPTYENGKVFIHIRTIWSKLGLRTGYEGLCEFAFDDKITSQNHLHVYSWDYLNARKAVGAN